MERHPAFRVFILAPHRIAKRASFLAKSRETSMSWLLRRQLARLRGSCRNARSSAASRLFPNAARSQPPIQFARSRAALQQSYVLRGLAVRAADQYWLGIGRELFLKPQLLPIARGEETVAAAPRSPGTRKPSIRLFIPNRGLALRCPASVPYRGDAAR